MSLPFWLRDAPAALAGMPWLILALPAGALVLLAAWKRIYPHTVLLCAFLLPCAVAVLVVLPEVQLATPGGPLALDLGILAFRVALTLDVLLVKVAVLDLFTLPTRRTFALERESARIASQRRSHRVELVLANRGGWRRKVLVRDDVPEEFDAAPPEFDLQLAPLSRAVMHYDLQARRRGAYALSQVHVQARSFCGLWKRRLIYPLHTQLYVYPDMVQLAEYAVLARKNRLSLLGVRRVRKIGQDNEFERLRDYTQDDNYKHIAWRATARRNKLTVKDFQVNQSQRLVFLLDCGRMMVNTAAGLSLLDHALNAMLMLSYVALRQGDSVGLLCFSDRIHSYTPLRGGMNQMNRLLHASFDRFPDLVESRYDQAFLYLSSHCLKRTLVVLVTNVIDEVNAHQVQRYLASLVGRHLPLGVLLRDHRLFDAAEQSDQGESAFYRAAAAAEILTWRHQVLADLEHQGVLTLDAFPEHMTAPLVNRYLDIKARHLL